MFKAGSKTFLFSLSGRVCGCFLAATVCFGVNWSFIVVEQDELLSECRKAQCRIKIGQKQFEEYLLGRIFVSFPIKRQFWPFVVPKIFSTFRFSTFLACSIKTSKVKNYFFLFSKYPRTATSDRNPPITIKNKIWFDQKFQKTVSTNKQKHFCFMH